MNATLVLDTGSPRPGFPPKAERSDSRKGSGTLLTLLPNGIDSSCSFFRWGKAGMGAAPLPTLESSPCAA